MSNLLIVESPAKAKTINKYLGTDFKVMASYGHVRDLIPKEGAVDPDKDFEMKYEITKDSAKHVKEITSEAKKSDAIYLATDLDREGEAISWHVYEILRQRGALKNKPVHRVVFSEITPRAIREAVDHPRDLSTDLINAQQARRALDYLVGFNLSPLLWRKIRPGTSAGRVQSPALRLIVEREEEIERFEPREYWTITANLKKDDQAFDARLVLFGDEKVEQFTFTSEADATRARETLEAAANGSLPIVDVSRKQRKKHPAAPFITSTLQQEASRKLRFSARRTMRIAQQLYEGIEVEGESQGLITYMRTDSVHLANDAIDALRRVIGSDYGQQNLPDKPNTFKTKSKNAQEAHEAIRPVDPAHRPDRIKKFLSDDQFRLYELIWKRAVASQMQHATLETLSVEFACGDGNRFRVTGSTVIDPGFLLVYEEDQDEPKDKNGEARLPQMKKGESAELEAISPEQHFTQPPPRYTEASLVKTLEEFGIGRPSTYASIISTLLDREYAELDKRRFVPTDMGRVVAYLLSHHFTQYVDYDFTANLEDDLDAVSRGEEEWIPLLREFWGPFEKLLDTKIDEIDKWQRPLGEDPESGKPVAVKVGRYGFYVQIGTREDDEKPQFASLRSGQSAFRITLDEALELFKLPRSLGETPEGEPVEANIGRYGPYVRYGKKFVSIPDGEDPYTIQLDRAVELIAEKKKADANRVIKDFDDSDIKVLRGRYGPYVTDGKKNGKIPKDKEPEELSLADCEEILAQAPARKKRGGRKRASA